MLPFLIDVARARLNLKRRPKPDVVEQATAAPGERRLLSPMPRCRCLACVWSDKDETRG